MNRNDVIDAMKKAFEEANGYYMPYDGMEAALDAFLEYAKNRPLEELYEFMGV